MAHAVFYGAMSLDGYLADKEDRLEWLYRARRWGACSL
jgi:hypothetical protein